MASLFFSYSHKDEDFRNEIETHLALLRRQGVISAWHDRRISAGSDFNAAISSELESAQIILLLISANFLASDYCFEVEMNRALEKHRDGSAVVIPVILHPCDWHSSPFGGLRATPTDGKPISMHANLQEALAIVAKDIREVAQGVTPTNTPRSTPSSAGVPSGTSITSMERSSNLRIKKKFDDHERDEFIENSYEYMARFFEGSLQELSDRNPNIKTKFKRVDATRFSTSIYDAGKRIAQCSIWYGGRSMFGSRGIVYSNSAESDSGGGYNESLTVEDDGFTLQLKPLGMGFGFRQGEGSLSQQGAAEYFWSILIRPLQQ